MIADRLIAIITPLASNEKDPIAKRHLSCALNDLTVLSIYYDISSGEANNGTKNIFSNRLISPVGKLCRNNSKRELGNES